MFHEGTLQSGISTAIKEQKLVACFVTDDGDESTTWETEWLRNGWIANLLSERAVLLRIVAGSTESGFLAAFCPVERVPTFIVIQNGQLKEKIEARISQDDFVNRIRTVLGASPIPGVSQSSSSSQASTPAPVPAAAPVPVSTQRRAQPSSQPSAQLRNVNLPVTRTPPPTAPAPAPAQNTPVSPILPPSSKAKGKQKATPPAPKPSGSASTPSPAQSAARDALRKKKQEEKDELARIKARIEADKTERRAQNEARKAERESSTPTAQAPSASTSRGSAAQRRSQAKDVHLNIRLFDGRTIRRTFPRTSTLQSDVRSWIDEEFATTEPGQKHPPYYFRQILAPLPSRELSAGEEGETIGDIDLAPSATLVLIPVKGYSDAYTGGGGAAGGIVGGVSNLVGGVFGLVGSAVGYVGGALGGIVGYGDAAGTAASGSGGGQTMGDAAPASSSPQRQDTPTTGPGSGSTGSSIRVRTLADQREGEPRNRELYNGNQLNFEPNEDDSNAK